MNDNKFYRKFIKKGKVMSATPSLAELSDAGILQNELDEFIKTSKQNYTPPGKNNKGFNTFDEAISFIVTNGSENPLNTNDCKAIHDSSR